MTEEAPLLEVRDLRLTLNLRRGDARAVDGVSLTIAAGETLGVVGESGSGKTMTGLAIMKLLPTRVRTTLAGSVRLEGRDVLTLTERQMAAEIRGSKIAMISQDPMMSLNPVYTVGDQVSGPLRYHPGARQGRDTMAMTAELLERVRIPSPQTRLKDYPHQFSGGMRQRVVTAMAIACTPRLLIADEPTTALDVTIQVQIMSLLKRIQRESAIGIMLITHDLGVAAGLCHRIAVMYAGRIIETGTVEDIYRRPAHPYTRALLAAVPTLGRRTERLSAIAGQPPHILDQPSGCRFAPRCPHRMPICDTAFPEETQLGGRHSVKCWLATEKRHAA